MRLVVILLIVIPSITQSFYAQLSYKTNLETGLFFKSTKTSIDNASSIYKLFGNLKYKTTYQNSESSISLKVRPELLDKDFFALKLGVQGDYIYRAEKIIWKSHINFQNFGYSRNDDNYNFQSFSLISGADINITNKIPMQLLLGYSYQNVEFVNELNSDYVYLDAKIFNSISAYSSISYGLFIENFATEGRVSLSSDLIKSNGWYYGPQINFSFMKYFLLNIGYKFLLINSKKIEDLSFEHRINTIGALRLNSVLSLFLHVDFYLRKTIQKNSDDTIQTLLPTKNENHITLKINYKLLNNFAIYVKSGYFRENLFSDEKHLDGLNLLLGVELKN